MHFTNFTKGRCRFQEVTVDLCTRFQKYLLSKDYISIKNPHKNKRLSKMRSTRICLCFAR